MSDETRETPVHSESRSAGPRPVGAPSRWLAPAALLVAVVAVILAIWALVSPPSHVNAPPNAPESATQPGDAKGRVCGAVETVTKVQNRTDLGGDPEQAAVAASARLAWFGGGQYLLNRVDSATPPELADAVRQFANKLQDIGMNALAGVSNGAPEQVDRLNDANALRTQIAELCK